MITVPPIPVSLLLPGDVLLYRPKGLFGWIIRVKTWHRVAHCEVYVGAGQSVAARDGVGVNQYPWRNTELTAVLRPDPRLDLAKALRWFAAAAKGRPYGWLDLSAFLGLKFHSRGMFCSEFVAEFLRAGGLTIFNDEDARDIAPFEFLTSECLRKVWSDDVGHTR